MSRHQATAAQPAGPSIWATPRLVGPAKHRAAERQPHRHTFILVAEFEGRRAGIAQCLTRLDDGTICDETETRWAK